MMTKTILLVILLGIFGFSQSSAAEFIEQVSMNGYYTAQLYLKPDPPRMGINNTAVLKIYESDSKLKVDGALIEVTPWMTVHSHGSSKKTRIKDKGNGVYAVEDIYFTMEGQWDLIVKITKNRMEDQIVFTIKNIKK